MKEYSTRIILFFGTRIYSLNILPCIPMKNFSKNNSFGKYGARMVYMTLRKAKKKMN